MNTFKKKSLYAAVLAGLGALGAAGTANAVHLNPDGLGQVLIYPYYTTRVAAGASFNTLMSVVNTTNQTKLVKVRFLEGRNSREVLDFNLFLSPNDVFTGVVVPTAAGASFVTNDNSCVTPSDLFSGTGGRAGLNVFKNFQYSAPNGDTGPTDLDRTREGYFEVIEMGVVTDATVTGYAKHGANNIPNNCPALDAYDPGSGGVAPNIFPGTFLAPPSGGLGGRANVISAGTGANYAYDATAFDAWSNIVAYTATGQVLPRLGQASPPVSNVFVGAGANSSGVTGNVNAVWTNGANAFSATIMRNTVLNEYVLDAGTVSQTDWVLTFPTKREYVSPSTTITPAAAPFASNFTFPGGSCDPYGFAVYDREERTTGVAPNVILPSPLPPATIVSGSGTCWEATVVPFQAGSSLLGSINTSFPVPQLLSFVGAATTTAGSLTSPGLPATNGPNGWLLISYNGATQGLTPTSATLNGAPLAVGRHTGLPVISLAFTNFNKAGVVSQYGQVSQAKYTRNIQ